MAKYIDQISCLENLMLAWRKLEHAFRHGDVWFDELIISAFKMNLVDNLSEISKQLKEGTYQMKPIQPIPYPKGKDSNGILKVRQSFFVDFRDQLVWLAVCNIIGHIFDVMMPAWSYGNRQYISMWKDEKDGKQFWVVGYHRNTTRQIYRKWHQSWPMMRKRITASLKKMARLGEEDLDDIDTQVSFDENDLVDCQNFIKLQYLKEGYFPKLEGDKTLDNLYWAGIDLEQFYQKIKIDNVRIKIEKILRSKPEYDNRFANLLKTITHFEIDYSDYQYEDADEDLEAMQLKDRHFEGLPTGLIVAGMLANIFMIDIDKKVSARLKKDKDIIHFRYVDDHVIISTSEEKLFEWLAWYQKLLNENGLKLNALKIAPEGLLNGIFQEGTEQDHILEDLNIEVFKDVFIKNIQTYACIDPKYPSPLMTQTLQKVSMLQGQNLDMLSAREYKMVFSELQSLLVADIPEQEIKESTRISFACTMLSRLIVNGDVDYDKIHDLRLQWVEQVEEIKKKLLKEVSENNDPQKVDSIDKINEFINVCSNIIFTDAKTIDYKCIFDYPDFKIDVKCLKDINKEIEKGQLATRGKERQVFNLLLHALDKAPDKVRIWVRVFEYCVRHEPTQIGKLYEKLNYCCGKSLHKLSVDFLIALINTLCAEYIIKATARLVLKDYIIPSDADKDRQFLENIGVVRNVEMQESTHFFVKDSQVLLNKAFAFANLYADTICINANSCEIPFFSSSSEYHGYNLDNTFWLLWIADLLKKRGLRNKPIFNGLLSNYLEEVNVKSNYFRAFFFAYLREVSKTSSTEMKLPNDLNSSFLSEVQSAKYPILYMQDISGLEKLLGRKKQRRFIAKSIKNRLNLIEWIDCNNSIKREDPNLELKNSELISVLIVLSVIKIIEELRENSNLVVIHPENFYLKIKEINNSWSHFISMVDKKEYLDVAYRDNQNLNSISYEYPKILNDTLDEETSYIYGLGIIFLQLLSKKKILPWALNSEQVGFEWQYVLHELQGQGRISSFNYRILSACLSPRQRENILLNQILDKQYVCEAYLDNPEIQNLEQLKEVLMASLNQLRDNLVSVANEAHRQLTVIDLD